MRMGKKLDFFVRMVYFSFSLYSREIANTRVFDKVSKTKKGD